MPISTPKFKMDVKVTYDFPYKDFEAQVVPIVQEGLKHAMKVLKNDFFDLIIKPLVRGGAGWYSIKDTQTWKWINSKDGYGQLGFTDMNQPYKMLSIYEKTYYVNLNEQTLEFGFGDIDALSTGLKHTAAGTGNLPADRSWFDWIYEGVHFKTEPAKFRRTGPRKGVRSSAIAGPYAGRMIKYRKAGSLWEVPPRYRLDMDKFLERNEEKIQKTIEDYIVLGVLEYIYSETE